MIEQFAKQADEKYGFPWESIIELILTLMEDCFNNEKNFVQAVKNPTMLQRIALRVRTRQVLGIRGRKSVTEACDGILADAAQLSDVELTAAYREGKGVFVPLDYIFYDEE